MSIRTPWLTKMALAVNVLTASWAIRLLRWGTFAALIVFRRWRHLFVFIGAIIVLELLTYQLGLGIGRPRPLGVTILASWTGYSMPSQPVAGLAITLIGMAYTLVVPGKHRYQAKWAIGIILVAVCFSRMYLAVDQPTARDVRRDPGRGGRAHCVPLVHTQRRVPRDVPAREVRAPRRRRAREARRSFAPRRTSSAST